jgi:FtsP/CotA-like multicopper oxidase with cupredoxin domain
VRRFLLILAAALSAPAVAACDDPTSFLNEPVLRADSALVLRAPTAPGADAPSALNGAGPNTVSPERPQFAGQYDFALRQSGSTFRFVVTETSTRAGRPGIALSTTPYANIEEASRRRSEYADSSVVLVAGASYTYRTRQYQSAVGPCFNYGKLRVLTLDPAAGTASVQAMVNLNCDDERLTAD